MIEYPKSPNLTMADVQRMIKKLNLNSHYGVIKMTREKIKPNFHYQRGHPAGYTDDLGIIADRNQWVEEQPRGWRSEIDPQDYMAIREWCEQNLKHGDWCTGVYYIILQREEDVAWFMLRWS